MGPFGRRDRGRGKREEPERRSPDSFVIDPVDDAGAAAVPPELQWDPVQARAVPATPLSAAGSSRQSLDSQRSGMSRTASVVELKELFDTIDTDGSGAIDADELHVGAKMLGITATKEEIEDIIKSADADGNGELDFEEFVAIINEVHSQDAKGTTATIGRAMEGIRTPLETFQYFAVSGERKAAAPVLQSALMAVMAGLYIGSGAFLTFMVGGLLPGIDSSDPGLQNILLGAFGLPFGLLMVVLTGADLFTGNVAYCGSGLLEGKCSLLDTLKVWVISWVFNFLGCLLMVGLVLATGLVADREQPLLDTISVGKMLPFGQAVARGTLCNWLVCMALWQASMADSLPGKFLGIWLPISAFVAQGCEHSVANMFFIPMGMVTGADVSISQLLVNNLIPVTIGNILGGLLMVAGPMALRYGDFGNSLSDFKIGRVKALPGLGHGIAPQKGELWGVISQRYDRAMTLGAY